MLYLQHNKRRFSHTWHVYRDKKTKTGYLGTVWKTLNLGDYPTWEMYVCLTDETIVTPIQFENELDVVMFLANLNSACTIGITEGH